MPDPNVGVVYSYAKNLQGDIIAILDSAGTAVVSYTYDAWGTPTGTTGSMAATLGALNPFRYRGYVYDEETGLYYLRNRFYNQNVGRFLNSDSIITGNIYNYCWNMPVSNMDQDGLEPTIVRTLPLKASRFSFSVEGVRPSIALAVMIDSPQYSALTSYGHAHPGFQLLEITAAATAEPEISFRSSTGHHNTMAVLAYNVVDFASVVGDTIGDGVSIYWGPGAGDLVKAGLAIAGELLPSKPMVYEYEIYSLTYEYHDSVPGFRKCTITQTFARCEDSSCSEHTHEVNVEVFFMPEYDFNSYKFTDSYECLAD